MPSAIARWSIATAAIGLFAAVAAAQVELRETPIEPGDMLFIDIHRAPELTQTYQVDSTGSVSLPYVGAIALNGMTPSEASGRMSEILRRILRNPRVTVTRSGAGANIGLSLVGRSEDMRLEIVPLHNSSAETMSAVLQGMSSPGGSVSYDPQTNALVITDTPTTLRNMMNAVSRLDQMQSQITQVRIEAKLAEVRVGALKEMGVRWFIQGDNFGGGFIPPPRQTVGLNALRGGISPLANEIIGSNSNNATTTQDRQFVNAPPFDRRLNIPVNVPVAGQSFLGYSNAGIDVGVMLDMLASDDKAEVLANPMIMTVNHRKAEIRMVDEFPYLEFGTEISGRSNFSVKFLDMGIIVFVTPHVYRDSTDSYVNLDLDAEVSFPVGSSNGVPIRSVRRAALPANVRNGQTLVVGGILSDSERSVDTKVPGLGDLPIIGRLFKHSEDEKFRTELMIFVTPTIHERPEEITWDEMIDVAGELRASGRIPVAEIQGERRRD